MKPSIAIVLVGVLSMPGLAVEDPTRPQAYRAPEVRRPADTPPTLSSILIGSERRVAVLDGQLFAVGDVVAGYRVEMIASRSVTLKGPRGSLDLVLPGLDKKIRMEKRMARAEPDRAVAAGDDP